uniref:restriction endonuclease subunit S n=1 Tax=Flavobacterium sp. TaxID=239 RepID=UPI0040486400
AGGTPRREEPSYWNGTIPWVGSTVCKDIYVTKSEEFITEDGLKNSSAKLLKKETSLIALVGATIGKTGFLTFDCTTNQNVAGLYPKDLKQLHTKYLFFSIQNLYSKFLNLSEGKFRMANLSFVRDLKIPLPPLSVQGEIVTEIESYQKIIDGAKMVVDNYKPRIEIDSDWEVVELGDIAKLIGGGTPSKQINEYWENGDIDWVSCSDFTSNSVYLPDSIRKITKVGLKNSSFNLIEKETLILVTRVSLGKMAFTKKPTAINQDLTALVFNDVNIDKFFVYYFLLSISDKIEQDGNGITVKGVNRDYVKSIKIPFPSLETQQQIVSQIEKEQALVNANKELIAIYEQKIKDRIAKVWSN